MITDYYLLNEGALGVMVAYRRSFTWLPTVGEALRYLIESGADLHPDHRSIAEALGVAQ